MTDPVSPEGLREAIDAALHELGDPGPRYPAPVANAVDILRAALRLSESDATPDRADSDGSGRLGGARQGTFYHPLTTPDRADLLTGAPPASIHHPSYDNVKREVETRATPDRADPPMSDLLLRRLALCEERLERLSTPRTETSDGLLDAERDALL